MLSPKIKLFLITVICSSNFLAFSQSKQSNPDSIIIQDGDAIITLQDAQSILNAMSFKQRIQLASDESILRAKLLGEFTLLRMSLEATKKNLQDDPIVMAKLTKSRRNILASALMDNQQKHIVITKDLEELAHEHYLLNTDRFTSKEEIKVAHILLKTEKGNETQQAETLAKSKKILEDIKQGLDFANAAKKYSADKSNAQAGGVMDYFTKGRMVPAFESAAFKLEKTGELSDLVKTKFGYHIIKFIDRKHPIVQTFEDVKSSIIAKLTKELIEDELNNYRDSFHADKNTTIFIPALKTLRKNLETDVNKTLKTMKTITIQ